MTLQANNLFYTPKSVEELQQRIESGFTSDQKAAVWQAVFETWNLCAHILESGTNDSPAALQSKHERYLEELTNEYDDFLKRHKLPAMSADDLLADQSEQLSEYESDYLIAFIERWDNTQRAADQARRLAKMQGA